MDIRQWFIKYTWSANLALLAAIAFVWAWTINGYLADLLLAKSAISTSAVPAAVKPAAEYRLPVENIVSRDLFGAARKALAAGLAEGDTASVKPTTLRLKLIVIGFFRTDSPHNLATIQNLQDQKINVYQAGDTVSPEVTVKTIAIDRVTLLRNTGELEELMLGGEGEKPRRPGGMGEGGPGGYNPRPFPPGQGPPPATGPDLSQDINQVSPNQFKVKKAAIETALSDLNTIMTQARVIPNNVDVGGQRVQDGYRIFSIRPGSIFQYLGLQNGDVLNSINGQKLDNVEKALQLLQALRTESRFNIQVVRQGTPMEMSYDVE